MEKATAVHVALELQTSHGYLLLPRVDLLTFIEWIIFSSTDKNWILASPYLKILTKERLPENRAKINDF